MRVNICFVLGIAYIMIFTGMALESVGNVRESITITCDVCGMEYDNPAGGEMG